MSELVKLFTCLLIVFKEEDSSLGKVKIAIHEQIIRQPMDTLKVTYQLKILTAALFTVTILRRKLISTQWLSLVVLVTGVALVQLADQPTKPGEANANQSKVIGFSAAIAACFLSGFAGIYFEKILKGSNVSVWMRNIQLSFLSLPFGLVTCVINDYTQLKEKGFFYGYDGFVWYLVVLQATGGLIVAAVVKYADNILKGFATSLAIILSCIASVYIFDFHLTLQFAFGTSLVIGSVFLYGYVPRTHNRVKLDVDGISTLKKN
ncbi:hypothetical protein QYM36_005861 [Artemia franciscana]|uniref:UDP-N-acetylglucosamine transporter n=1 Tax=Artemia franciscana TaxID=6661 RepID=A0AA88ICI5_ARTSF|nr:hypothetical protein QYM36_005861 [Artemia franciscana]